MPAFSLGAASDLGPAPPRLAQPPPAGPAPPPPPPPRLIPWHRRLDGGVRGGGRGGWGACGHQVALLAQDRRPRCLPPARTKEGRDPSDHLCHLTLGGVAPELAILEGCSEELQLPSPPGEKSDTESGSP